MSSGKIRQQGIVKRKVKGNKFVVVLDDNPNHEVLCTLSGRMLQKRITPNLGDSVEIIIGEYDIYKGRVVWRF